MIELNLSSYRKARVWVGHLPQEAYFDSVSILQKRLPIDSNKSKNLADNLFAVEIVIPRGGMTTYGLLGAEYINCISDNFSVEVYSSELETKKFNNSLCADFETAFIGLPAEYANFIQKNVVEYLENEINFIPTGNLIFKCAAHGKIGSNQEIFKELSTVICEYLFSTTALQTDEDYKNLILRNIK